MRVVKAPAGYVFLRGSTAAGDGPGKYWLVRVEPMSGSDANDLAAHKMVTEMGDVVIGIDYSQPAVWIGEWGKDDA